MTPDTTPPPMTHEGDAVFIPKPCCIRADGACFEEGECLSDCEALDQVLLRGANERELRQRLERAERDRNDWGTRADALAAERDEWRNNYRFQTAMRYMDNNPKLTQPKAYEMADEDVRRFEAVLTAEREALRGQEG